MYQKAHRSDRLIGPKLLSSQRKAFPQGPNDKRIWQSKLKKQPPNNQKYCPWNPNTTPLHHYNTTTNTDNCYHNNPKPKMPTDTDIIIVIVKRSWSCSYEWKCIEITFGFWKKKNSTGAAWINTVGYAMRLNNNNNNKLYRLVYSSLPKLNLV